MNSAIEKLEQELWDACVIQRASQNQEMTQRWQTDEYSHLKERFLVQTMPTELNHLVQNALLEWQSIENKVCLSSQIDREHFLIEFEKLRQDFLNGDREWLKVIKPLQAATNGAVRNMDWVNLFAWVLPNADKEHTEELRVTGRMVAAIFYIELLSKHGNNPENDNLKKIEARWRLVNKI
jgi:hypothetical protein